MLAVANNDQELIGTGAASSEMDEAKEFFEPTGREDDYQIGEDPTDEEHHMLLSSGSSTIKAFPSSPVKETKPLQLSDLRSERAFLLEATGSDGNPSQDE